MDYPKHGYPVLTAVWRGFSYCAEQLWQPVAATLPMQGATVLGQCEQRALTWLAHMPSYHQGLPALHNLTLQQTTSSYDQENF